MGDSIVMQAPLSTRKSNSGILDAAKRPLETVKAGVLNSQRSLYALGSDAVTESNASQVLNARKRVRSLQFADDENQRPDRLRLNSLGKENEKITIPSREDLRSNKKGAELLASPSFRERNGSSGTFGRKASRRQGRGGLATKKSLNLSISSQSQWSRSRDTSPSRNSDPETQWTTPRSTFYTRYNSSSSSRVAFRDLVTPSPTFTFGVPSTPPSRSSDRHSRTSDMFFNHTETPPPLPPLNHPAFNFPSRPLEPSSERKSRDKPINQPRPARSLPSVKPDKRASSTPPSKKARREAKSSLRSEADTHQAKGKEPQRRGHMRSESKGSIASSRRSSAEFSAKRASLLGVANEADEPWEVKVSRELLRLSLEQNTVEGHASARGRPERNRSRSEGGEARGFGSSFSFQDFLPPLQARTQHRPSVVRAPGPQQQLKFPSIDSRPATSMSDADIVNGSRQDNVKGTGRSTSRRAGNSSSKHAQRTPSPPPPKLGTAAPSSQNNLLVPPSLSFTAPTPEASPISPPRRIHVKSSPTPPTNSPTPLTPPPIQKSRSASAKRKADEAGVDASTPPKEPREYRATFAPEPRTHRASAASSSHAPTSFHRNKRARISLSSEHSQHSSRTPYGSLIGDSPNAKSTGSWSSRGSLNPAHYYQSSRPPSTRDAQGTVNSHTPRRSASRRSISNHSIPISAYMSPHAPSVTPSGTFHMRDPRKPARIQDTPWSLSLPVEVEAGEGRWSFNGWVDRGGSPLHAWLFFIGFIIFPLWWLAGFVIPIPRTRRLEGGDEEKGVILDDPQVEHDYKSWRRRCRIMGGIAFVTYIPFIILIAVFV
ncbi:hypothetical protein CC2G_012695 [Coprinopsis cinerea AmutBmut pab1-1]|nr:hypothetical protein CC2G_012695 [Coprinopsis cinerea AmutBmut pab1-1]